MTNPSKTPSVDFSYLEEYTGGDQEVIAELIEVCKSTAKEGVETLESNIHSDDLTQWCAAAHKLKGAAGYVGATVLKALCDKAQGFELPVATAEVRQALYDDLFKSYEDVIHHLEEYSK